jgi:hypothetical protein
MHIDLDKEFFAPATFKNGDSPVNVIKTGYSEYHCKFSGKGANGKFVNWTSKDGEGGSSDPRGH